MKLFAMQNSTEECSHLALAREKEEEEEESNI